MRLTKEQNVERGYAVYTPSGIYRKPSCMNARMKNLVDDGYLTVSVWGKVELTSKWDDEIASIPKPELKPLTTGSSFDLLLADLEESEISKLSDRIKSKTLMSTDHYLISPKPSDLLRLEADLDKMMKGYWTAERKQINRENDMAQHAYDSAVMRIMLRKEDAQNVIDKAESFLTEAVERSRNPIKAAAHKKIVRIIEDKKRSSEAKTLAILNADASAGAADSAKRAIIITICALLGKGRTEGQISAVVQHMPEFQALHPKRPEKAFNRLYKSAVTWISYKNQHKVFHDLKGHVSDIISNVRIRTKTKNTAVAILTLTALHQAKDNDSRGIMAFRYTSNLAKSLTCRNMVSETSLDPKGLGEKFASYANFGYITFVKGERGGMASKAGLLPFSGKLTQEDSQAAEELILQVFEGSEIHTHLKHVLSTLTWNTVDSQKSLVTAPAYENVQLETAVDALLTVFSPLSRKTADDRIVERHAEEVPYYEALEAAHAEVKIFVDKYLAAGVGWGADAVARTSAVLSCV